MTVSYCTKNTCPVAINTQRVYDAIRTQMFTDATALDGSTLYFEYEVADVRGNVPTNGLANVKIDEVCMNYSSIEIIPGCISLEDFEVIEIEDAVLRREIKAALKLESDEITVGDMHELTSLRVLGNITSLKGLEHARNLESLNIDYKEIKDLSPLKKIGRAHV